MNNFEYDPKKLFKLLPSYSPMAQGFWKCQFCTFLNTCDSKYPHKRQCKICENYQPLKPDLTPYQDEECKLSDFDNPEEFPLDATECPQCGFKFSYDSKEFCQCGINLSQLNEFIIDFALEKEQLAKCDSLSVKKEELLEPDPMAKLGIQLLEKNGMKGGAINIRVWYPKAKRIRFLGDFNGFSFDKPSDQNKFDLKKDKSGVFSLYLEERPGFSFIGQRFKYYIEKSNGLAEWRNDPRSIMLIGQPNMNDLIYDHSIFVWSDQHHRPPPMNSLILYETHISALCDNKAEGAYFKAIQKLDYLKQLGINGIELMPITQDIHEKCWGYDPISLFAVHKNYGSADELKSFINEAHNRGISVILDWVPNHICKMSILHEDYFYPLKDEKHKTRYGPRPDYSKIQVKAYLLDSLSSWLQDFHFDGIRVDSLESMRFTENSQKKIIEAWTFLQEMTAFIRKQFPEKILIAEDLQNDDKINGLLGFDSQWDPTFFSVMLNAAKASEDSSRNSYEIAKILKSRYEAHGFGRILYSENHDTVPEDRQMRIIKAINPANKLPDLYAKRRSRLITSVSFVGLGVPMLMAGQELMEMRGGNWPNPAPIPFFHKVEDLPKEQENSFNFFYDLMRLRLNLDGVSQGLRGGNLAIIHIHPSKELPILAIHRWDKGGPGDDVIIVMNFSNNSFKKKGYWINFPRGGIWKIRICSEGTNYWFEEKPWGTKVQEYVSTELDNNRIDGYMFAGKLFLKKYSMLILSQD